MAASILQQYCTASLQTNATVTHACAETTAGEGRALPQDWDLMVMAACIRASVCARLPYPPCVAAKELHHRESHTAIICTARTTPLLASLRRSRPSATDVTAHTAS